MNLKDISIHAPARGATATNIENGKYSGDFNPRSREGSDLGWFVLASLLVFQSTLPRGERPEERAFVRFLRMISIHAPARGATYPIAYTKVVQYISIHAPARGATCAICDIL